MSEQIQDAIDALDSIKIVHADREAEQIIRSALEAARQEADDWSATRMQLAGMLNAGVQLRPTNISLWVGVDSNHPVNVFDASDPVPCSTFTEALAKTARHSRAWLAEHKSNLGKETDQ